MDEVSRLIDNDREMQLLYVTGSDAEDVGGVEFADEPPRGAIRRREGGLIAPVEEMFCSLGMRPSRKDFIVGVEDVSSDTWAGHDNCRRRTQAKE